MMGQSGSGVQATSSGDQLGNRVPSGGRNSAQSNPAIDLIAQAYAKRRQLD